MSLITGSPIGTIETSEELFLEGAPYIYYQSASATPLKNPDANGCYWGLSGTSTYNVYELGCVTAVTLSENQNHHHLQLLRGWLSDVFGNQRRRSRPGHITTVLEE